MPLYKQVRARNKLPYSVKQNKTAVSPIFQGLTAIISLINCQRQDFAIESTRLIC